MITRAAIVAEARRWLGVPYHHQGRSTAGVDCAGLVVVVANALGVDTSGDVRGYGLQPEGERLARLLERVAVPVGAAQPGDILLLRFERLPQHLAIATDVGLIHSHARAGRVVEHSLDWRWQRRVLAAYAFPGVA